MKTPPNKTAFRALLLSVLLCWVAPGQASITNQLKDHPSPYLALHGDDPVAWQDWSRDVLELAGESNKLLFISSGYFSCHWCHVMQGESYQNPDIASYLNKYFVPVKIDRELESALDTRLIEFAQGTQGHAGWPLNVFITPGGHPIYAVTYLPPEQFKLLLSRINGVWRQNGEQIANLAAGELQEPEPPGEPRLDGSQVSEYLDITARTIALVGDRERGGFQGDQKFPMTPQMSYLVDFLQRNPDGNEDLREFLTVTLDRMASNGLVDHLGGGFFRYTVDPEWRTPHFEKMLYGNALLAVLYLRAAELLEEPRYAAVARKTLDFMVSTMGSEEGGFVASLSAVDDRDIEGGYYLWSDEQLNAALPPAKVDLAKSLLGMDGPRPLEHGWLPLHSKDLQTLAAHHGWSPEQLVQERTEIETRLREQRQARVLPVDDKLLAGWNGLALRAFAEAAAMDRGYESAARSVRDFLVDRLWLDDELTRSLSKGRLIGTASVEDYAFVAWGLLAFADFTGRESDYRLASDIARQAWRRFYDDGWILSEENLIAPEPRRTLIQDGAMPSPSAVLALVSLRLAEELDAPDLRRQALASLNTGHQQLISAGLWYATHLRAMMHGVN